jgi:cephalosporin-C deacetylase
MAWFDFPPEKLKTYNPAEKAPKDFDAFWKRTLAETAATGPAAPRFVQLMDPYFKLLDAYDVTFRGYMGQPVKAWFLEPAGNTEPLACIVGYQGYGGGRGLPIDHTTIPMAGFAYLFMDTRGQGSSWSPGDTGDDAAAGPQYPGFMTRGIESPDTYYYRRVFVDAARAIDAAAQHPHVDARRIAVTGGSQGGGISIAAAALAGKKVKLCMPDVPYLCHYSRATTVVDSMPYGEITNYLKTRRTMGDTAYRTLSYFDGIHLAPKITARCLFSVGLMDMTCPPSTVYAAYNRIRAPKEMRIYTHNNHEGGGPYQTVARLEFAAKYL